MPMQGVKAGSKYGFIPGSADVGGAMGYSPLYQGVASLIEPGENGYGDAMKQQSLDFNAQNQGRKNKLYDSLLSTIGGGGGTGSYNFQSWGQPIPSPSWASTAGVWDQGQINNQANSQTARLYAQAANQTRGYATRAANSGFSPMSPLTQFMQQTSNQKAGAAAAANETNLNWTAAAGNRDAQQKGEGINAGLYGSYTSALARQQEMQLQAQQQQWQQQLAQQQLLANIIGKL